MLSGMREKAMAVTQAGRESSKIVAKQKQLPSAGLDGMRMVDCTCQDNHVSTNY